MAAITDIRVAPSTGAPNPVITFRNGSQDQGGEIKAPTAPTNIAQGDPAKLKDGQTYRIWYTSAGHDYGPVSKKYEPEHGSTDAIFVAP